MDRHTKFLWMKDLLDHLGNCYDQWRLADDYSGTYLADAMRRDLDGFQRLCESLRPAAAAA